MTASEYSNKVYEGDIAYNEDDIWELIEVAVENRDVCEINNLLELMYKRY